MEEQLALVFGHRGHEFGTTERSVADRSIRDLAKGMRFAPNFCVSMNAQPNGDHRVHNIDLATNHLTTFRTLSPLFDRLGHGRLQQGDDHMAITVKPGARLFSAVCTTEMIAVKAPVGAVKPGNGSPALGREVLQLKEAKALPSSD
jgi:hypothetical protein